MNNISKGAVPPLLRKYREWEGATYLDMPADVRKELKDQLLAEQGHLCAYCMTRIKYDNMKVEHFLCRDDHEEDELDYYNMLGVCKGGGRDNKPDPPKEFLHCDKLKDNDPFNLNPSDPKQDCEDLLYYEGELIRSSDKVISEQLETVVNLNSPYLKRNRRNVLDSLFQTKKLKTTKGLWSETEINRILEKWSQSTEGKYKPFNGIAIFYLRKKIRSIQAQK